MVRYWVELLAAVGPPQPAVVADGPYGMAFGSRDDPALLAVNPSGRDRTVTFRTGGDPTATVALAPRRSVSRRP
jgi:endo-1,3(4)-beta-glucanase